MRKQVGEICGVRMVVDDEMPEQVWWLTWRGGNKELGIEGMKIGLDSLLKPVKADR